jgi:outer membrane protein OmpA-like peptidoglycan-associated protein
VIVGLKYENDSGLGIAVGYKKNLSFSTKGLAETHGAMGSISYVTGKTPPPPPCLKLEAVIIKGANQVKEGENRTYAATYSPLSVTKPVAFNWTCSDNGVIKSGQNSPTVSVKWNSESKNSWVEVSVSNSCSKTGVRYLVKVKKLLLAPKQEYFFAIDSSELSGSVVMDLKTALVYLKYHSDLKVEIQGHTCSIATVGYNMGLGEERAQAVKKFLVDNGISPDRISTISYGEERPAYDNSKEITRKKNRRVYIPIKK